MGCLNLQVINKTIKDLVVSIQQLNAVVKIVTICSNVALLVGTRCQNTLLSVNTTCGNTEVFVNAECENQKLSVNAGLVCGIGLNKYEVVYVDEGLLMVKDGYLLVKKNRV